MGENRKDLPLKLGKCSYKSFDKQVLEHPEARKYVAGIGVHWYGNFLSPPSILTVTHDLFPDRFLLATEACEGNLIRIRNAFHTG